MLKSVQGYEDGVKVVRTAELMRVKEVAKSLDTYIFFYL